MPVASNLSLQSISVFVGAHTLQFLKGTGKVGSIRIANQFPDFPDFQFGVRKQILRLLDSDGVQNIIKALPCFATNEQVKAAYSITFGALAPMLGLPTEAIEDLLRELNEL